MNEIASRSLCPLGARHDTQSLSSRGAIAPWRSRGGKMNEITSSTR